MITGNVLVVDDEPDICSLVKEILEDEGFNVDGAENAEQAKQIRETFLPDLILLDIWMPGIDGITLLKEWKETDGLKTPVIMMSGHGTVETAVEATKVGAYDFIEKPLSLAKLILTVKHVLETVSLQRENLRLRGHGQLISEPIGKSQIMQQLRDKITHIANHNTPVLISGESGTDKELFARFLHSQGNRADAPFISIGISALSKDHAIQELFGSEEGNTVKPGIYEQAEGGILFLKDIADMDAALQAKLQNTLENHYLTRVGGTEPCQVDVRIVAATSHDLQDLVKDGKFRDDLFYQLNVLPLQIPPLRDHYEDIPELLEWYVNYFVEREDLPYKNFTTAAQN
ncbi:MAG: sigma-54 dependent transcriptional regulator, partial [Gammaproteobacteria bacterium]